MMNSFGRLMRGRTADGVPRRFFAPRRPVSRSAARLFAAESSRRRVRRDRPRRRPAVSVLARRYNFGSARRVRSGENSRAGVQSCGPSSFAVGVP